MVALLEFAVLFKTVVAGGGDNNVVQEFYPKKITGILQSFCNK